MEQLKWSVTVNMYEIKKKSVVFPRNLSFASLQQNKYT